MVAEVKYKKLNSKPSNRKKYKIGIVAGFTLLISIYFYYAIFQYLFVKNHFDPVSGTEGNTCPACFGGSACPEFFRGEINIKGIFRLPVLHRLKTRHIYEAFRGLFNRKTTVILKKLATTQEISKTDSHICKLYNYKNLNNKCFPRMAIWEMIDEYPSQTLQISHVERLKKSAPMMHCVTERLFKRMNLRFRERASRNIESPLLRRDEVMLMYMLHLNQHSLMLQLFPTEDGWPFPHYLGACGRWELEEHAGLPITDFCDAPMWKRVKILIGLLSLPDQLEKAKASEEGYVLYIEDADIENFMVNPETLAVKIVDLEHMMVVDVEHLRKLKMDGSDQEYRGAAELCGLPVESGGYSSNCSATATVQRRDSLCGHVSSDHNHQLMCALPLIDHGRLGRCLLGTSDPELGAVTAILRRCVQEPGQRRQHLAEAKHKLEQIYHVLYKPDL